MRTLEASPAARPLPSTGPDGRPRRILYVQYTNPGGYPPLEHSSRILAQNGWEVLFLGVGVAGVEALRLPAHPGIVVRTLGPRPTGWRQKVHYAQFILWVVYWVLRWRPHWVYASDPLACPPGLLVSYLTGHQVVYHEHDSPSPHLERSLFMRVVAWARRKLARRARACVLPNRERGEMLRADSGTDRPVLCVHNCARGEEVSPPREERSHGELVVYYHGNISPVLLPEAILKALAMLPDAVRLWVAGYETAGATGYVEHLREEAARLGVEGRIEFCGSLPRKELLRLCRRADVGLALVPRQSDEINLRHLAGASNKPFDYLACGLALLVSDLPDWRAAYVEAGCAMACDPADPQGIAAALRWFLEHPSETRDMGERGRLRVVAEWNYETQFALVRALVED